jgi:multidrug efflux pump subunit AcrA (membrane-fusion protein)
VKRGAPLIKIYIRTNTGSAAELITSSFVTAPAPGRLTRSNVQVGSYLSRGATVAVLQDWSRLHASFRLPAPLAKQLVLGQQLPVKVLDSLNRTLQAEVYQLTQVTSTQAVLVLQFDNPGANLALRPGMPVRLRLPDRPLVVGGLTVSGR